MKRVWKIALAVLATALIAGVIALDIPNWKQLDIDKIRMAAASTVLYDSTGIELSGLYSGEKRQYATLAQMPDYLPGAFVAAEDARFYEHRGVDIRRIFGALWSNIRSMSLSEGASTITQQLVRMTHLSTEKTFSRKAQEAWLALQLERRMSKDEILEYYINIAYYGSGAYGAAAAAQVYFSKDVAELTLAEAALLAGLVKAPSSYAPDTNPEKALARRGYVLARMLECGYISQEEYAYADVAPLELHMAQQNSPENGWYVDAVLEEAMAVLDISAEAFLSGGYRVYTALDTGMQAQANALYADSSLFPASAADGTPAQSALVAVEPASGEILCMVGGREYAIRRGLNRATSIRRQPGSAFKPISVYAAAVDNDGYLPSSFVQDEQRDFGGGYSPGNAGGHFYGTVTLRTALSKSLNAASVDLLTKVGISSAQEYARRLGIPLTSSDSGLSLALGALTEGVSPLEMCSAYSALANSGTRMEAHCIRRIEDHLGNVLYEFSGHGMQAMQEQSACMLTSMLESAVSTGSAKALQNVGFPVAAKTGTVAMEEEGNRDAWIAAYTQNVAVCVWMGFDEPDAQHHLAEGSGGSAYPARLAAAFLSACASRADSGAFPLAEGVVEAQIDGAALNEEGAVMLSSEYTPPSQQLTELFYVGREPTIISNYWHAPDMVWDLRVQQQNGVPVISFTAQAGAGYRVYRTTQTERTLIADVVSSIDDIVQIIDGAADRESAHSYTVVPYNAALAAEDIDLSGTECLPVVWSPASRLWEWLEPDSSTPAPATQEEPLFSGLGS